MKTSFLGLFGLALLLASLGLLAGDGAQADEEKVAETSGVWVYDVRVVRVDPATAETSETPSTLESTSGCTVSLSWAEMLAVLKKRGKTTILMDQRLTATTGVKGVASSERQFPIVAVNFQDDNNTQLRSATVKSGCKFEATARPDLMYRLEVKWVTDPYADATAPVQMTTSWSGTHPPLEGETLVLSYREQVAGTKGEKDKPGTPPRSLEIYGLITGRFLPSK